MMRLTEKKAAFIYAKAWNRLDCTEFLDLLDDTAHYASQWVFDELENKEAIADYLINKIVAVKNSDAKVYAELGITRSGFAGRYCVFITQGEKQAVVLFEVSKNKIQRFDLCIPELLNVKRTGVYPM